MGNFPKSIEPDNTQHTLIHCMFLKYSLILFMFNFQRPKAETKFRQRLVTDGRVSAQDASAATWIIGCSRCATWCGMLWYGKVRSGCGKVRYGVVEVCQLALGSTVWPWPHYPSMPEIVEPQVTQPTPPASIAYLFLHPFAAQPGYFVFLAGKQHAEDLLTKWELS